MRPVSDPVASVLDPYPRPSLRLRPSKSTKSKTSNNRRRLLLERLRIRDSAVTRHRYDKELAPYVRLMSTQENYRIKSTLQCNTRKLYVNTLTSIHFCWEFATKGKRCQSNNYAPSSQMRWCINLNINYHNCKIQHWLNTCQFRFIGRSVRFKIFCRYPTNCVVIEITAFVAPNIQIQVAYTP